MNSDALLEYYSQFADAPDAVAHLRRLVVKLATTGKLAKQHDGDSPADFLIDRLPEEISRLAERGASSRAISTATHRPTTRKHHNKGWVWVEASALFPTRSGNSKLIKGKLHSEPAEKRFAGYSAAGQDVWLDNWEHEGLAVILSAVGARCGKAFLADGRWSAVANTHIIWLMPEIILPEFAMLHLNDEDFWIRSGGAQPFVKVKDTLTNDFALPPLAEQQRIVAKVEELMELCDHLEAARAEREAGRDRLTAATLARLNAPDPETFPADARFALDNLTPLTTRPDQITQLRQTILSLAVRGKLVEHNEADGTGLDFMAALPMKEQGNGRGRRKIATRKIEPAEEYLDIPDNWTWARIHELGFTQTGTSPSSANPDFFGDFIPFVKPGDLDGAKIYYEGPGLSEEGVSQSRVAPAATVLMVCIGATLGKVNITDRNVCFNQQINSVTPYLPGTSAFLALTLKATGFQELAWSKAGTGTLPIISKGKWEILPVPVPPLAEQHRIVAKVDELMALCDQLEASLTAGDETRSRLLETVLHDALEPA